MEFFTNEKSFKERLQLYFIKNQRSSKFLKGYNLEWLLWSIFSNFWLAAKAASHILGPFSDTKSYF